MSRPLVMDIDDDGLIIRSRIWQCETCDEKEIAREDRIPRDWEVDDENDLENCLAFCPDCCEEE